MRSTEIAMRYKVASLPADYQIRIAVAPLFEHPSLGPAAPQNYNEAPIPRTRLPAMELVVNLFDGGPKSKVVFRVDDGAMVKIVRSSRIDALVAKLSLSIKDRSVFWILLRKPTHIWAAPQLKDMEPGVHRLAVRAVDDYGQVHEDSKLIEVTPYRASLKIILDSFDLARRPIISERNR